MGWARGQGRTDAHPEGGGGRGDDGRGGGARGAAERRGEARAGGRGGRGEQGHHHGVVVAVVVICCPCQRFWLFRFYFPVCHFVWPAAPMARKRAGEAAEEEGQPPCKKKKPVGSRAAASGAPPVVQAPVSAASGAPPLAQAPPAVPPLCITQLLETEGALLQKDQLAEWVRAAKAYVDRALHSFLRERETEMSFTLPPACSMILPLAIDEQQAASGANLSAFRQAMHYDNMMQYDEAAGTVWTATHRTVDCCGAVILASEENTGFTRVLYDPSLGHR